MTARLRVGVVGGGLIAQAVHLPTLRRLTDRFAIAAVADPSRVVSDALASRYDARAHLDWRTMLERETLDALVVCSPHATHAEVALAALDDGLHVFVEKPLCVTVADADAICARGAAVGRVVQVGYMKRFDPAYAALVDGLPDAATTLRMVDVVTVDPWMAREPFVPWRDMVQGSDVPQVAREALARGEAEQVEAAVGRGDPATVRAFGTVFLAALIHDVNLVHGVLEQVAGALPARPLDGSAWGDGRAGSVTLELANGGRWRSAWLLLDGVAEFRESVALLFDDAVHRLELPAPYLRGAATRHVVEGGAPGARRATERAFVADAYRAELEHFHDCIVEGAACRTPAEQGRADLALLRELFLAGA